MRRSKGLLLSIRDLIWTFNPLKIKSRVRPLTCNWRILIPTVGLSTTIAARFRAFSPLYIHHRSTCKWMNLEGKCLNKRETPVFSFAYCDPTVALFTKLSASLESSHRALKWVSISFLRFDTPLGHILSKKGHFTPPQNRISSLTTLVLGAPSCPLTCPCSCRFSSWVPIMYSCLHGPPSGPFTVWQHHRVALV